MSRAMRGTLILLFAILSLSWPFLLGGAVAGEQGLYMGLLFYLVSGGVLLGVLIFGGIRGILEG